MRNPLAAVVRSAGLATVVCFGAFAANGNEPSSPSIIDDFSDASRWEVATSDGVTLRCTAERAADAAAPHATTLRLDFDFKSSGYAGVRYPLPLDLPPNFELAFSVRGDLPPNNLEFKLVDETGAIVWWVNRRAFEFPKTWTRLASRRRHFQFAWGPTSEPLRKAGSLEIVVSSAEGGRGTIWLDDLTFRPLPETKPYTGKPKVAATSTAGDSKADFALDGNAETKWESDPHNQEAVLKIDFGQPREFGGMVVHWDSDMTSPHYDVEFSGDGTDWTKVRSAGSNARQVQFLWMPDSESRFVRLRIDEIRGGVGISEIEFLPLEVSRDANTFAQEIARRAPRGHYPRAIGGEGTFWTIVGVPGDDHEALLSEDGAVEVDKQAFSIEPFLLVDGRLMTWAEAKITQSLLDGSAPLPRVTREYDGLTLSITAAADGESGRSSLLLLYTLTNTADTPRRGALLLAGRSFQVNPPYQWLNATGGVSHITRIGFADGGREMRVDGRVVALGERPDAFGAAATDDGEVIEYLTKGRLPPHYAVDDAKRRASGACEHKFALAPGGSRSWAVCVPFSQDQDVQAALVGEFTSAANGVVNVLKRHSAVLEKWREATHTFELLVPPQAADVANSIRSTLAYILINQDGQAIHPGSRSYERSWIRDGSLTSAALLRFGMEKEAKEFVDWYGPFQFESGKVPCVVDHRGADPVPENDSHGQYIMAVMNVYRFTRDRAFLERHWPRVERAVAYIEQLRAERMTAEFAVGTSATRQEKGKPAVNAHAFYGLMPESISHEGYSAKPMHSYWDDFFTLKGLKDAAEMARIVNQPATANRYQALADDFARTLYASLDTAMKAHQLDYIPGCVELGDFDATSTTIALWPCDELGRLPKAALANTFDQYWRRFIQRRDDPSFAWVDYTPYELRAIGSFVLLGQPERAQQALAFFMNDRRPTGWNQWPEVIHRDPRTAMFIGDLPHTWCGSDFVNSVRMMFLYEREPDDALVLLAGVPHDWVSATPVGFRNLPTYGGRLTCTLSQPDEDRNKLFAQLEGNCPVPAGHLRLSIPTGRAASATVNGTSAEIDADGRVLVKSLPAAVTVSIVPKTGR
jgi:hypothetical protein